MLKLQVIGNIGSDCQVNTFEGKKVINFSVAATINQGQKSEKTMWIDCALWNRENTAPYLLKGVKVYLDGVPTLKVWNNKELEATGVFKLTVDNVTLLSVKPAAKGTETASEGPATTITADDLPF